MDTNLDKLKSGKLRKRSLMIADLLPRWPFISDAFFLLSTKQRREECSITTRPSDRPTLVYLLVASNEESIFIIISLIPL